MADGAVWVQHRDELLRLDPSNGKVRARIGNIYWAGTITQVEDGTIWATSWPGLVQVDPQTNERGLVFDQATDLLGSVVEQAGALWTADESKGVVYKVDPDSAKILDTYETGEGSRYLSAADGQVWVANQDVGTVTRIDALTGDLRTFSMEHPVVAVVAGADQAMVTVLPGKSLEDEIAALTGDVARVLAPAYAYFQLDPAIAGYSGNALQQQLANATCARLLRYPSDPAAMGSELEPEVATGLPVESNGGRTYTFTIGQGFAFSPPSNEPITAQTYAYSIERALSPVFGVKPMPLRAEAVCARGRGRPRPTNRMGKSLSRTEGRQTRCLLGSVLRRALQDRKPADARGAPKASHSPSPRFGDVPASPDV